jgi:putative FmdB family regulatory protein
MPTYDYRCPECATVEEIFLPLARFDEPQGCGVCKSAMMVRQVAAPLFKFAGRVTPGGGPDRFTADMLGIPLKELPAGLKADQSSSSSSSS